MCRVVKVRYKVEERWREIGSYGQVLRKECSTQLFVAEAG
jgi:hypothetical protein